LLLIFSGPVAALSLRPLPILGNVSREWDAPGARVIVLLFCNPQHERKNCLLDVNLLANGKDVRFN
jgi:hypothetical protein